MASVGTACTCSAEGEDDLNEEVAHAAAALAVDEVATVPFVSDELFMLFRELAVQLEGGGKQIEPQSNRLAEESPDKESCANDVNVGKRSRQAACEEGGSLDALHLSHGYRMLAEQSMKEGHADEAAAFYDEAYTEGLGYLPNRCVLLANCCLPF